MRIVQPTRSAVINNEHSSINEASYIKEEPTDYQRSEKFSKKQNKFSHQ